MNFHYFILIAMVSCIAQTKLLAQEVSNSTEDTLATSKFQSFIPKALKNPNEYLYQSDKYRTAGLEEDGTLEISGKHLILREGKEYEFTVYSDSLLTKNVQKLAQTAISEKLKEASKKLDPDNPNYTRLVLIASMGGFSDSWIKSLREEYIALSNYFDSLKFTSSSVLPFPELNLIDTCWFHSDIISEINDPVSIKLPLQSCIENYIGNQEQIVEETFKIKTAPCDVGNARLLIEAKNIERIITHSFYKSAYKIYEAGFKSFTCTDCLLPPALEKLQKLSNTYDRIFHDFRNCECEEELILDPCSPSFDSAYVLVTEVYPEISNDIKEELPTINPDLIKWMFITMWLHGGDLKLNPLPFTDKDHLPLSVYDTAKADRFNTYIDNLLSDMTKKGAINESRTDIALFDSLQELQGKGQDLYRVRVEKVNEQRLAKNTKDRLQYLAGNTDVIHEINFAVVARRGIYTPIAEWNPIGTSNRVRRLRKRFPDVVLGDRPAFLIARDIPKEQNVTVSPKKIQDIKGTNSNAVRGITQVVGLVAGLLEPTSALINLSGRFDRAQSNISNRRIPASVVDEVERILARGDLEGAAEFAAAAGADKGFIVGDEVCTAYRDYVDGLSKEDGALRDYLLAQYIPEEDRIPDISEIEHFLLQIGKDQVSTTTKTYSQECTNLSKLSTQLLQYQIEIVLCELYHTFESNNLGIGHLDKELSNFSDEIQFQIRRRVTDGFIKELSTLSTRFSSQRKAIAELTSKWGSGERWTLPPQPSSLTLSPAETAPASPPQFTTKTFTLPTSDSASEYTANALLNTDEGKKLDSLKLSYKSAPGTVISVSAGFTQTFDTNNGIERFEVTEADGQLTTESDDNHFRPFAALHLHPFRMMPLYDRFIFFDRLPTRDVLSRFSILVGTSFPKPLYNIHFGLGVDLYPGVKIVAGQHWFRSTKYEIINNTIADESSRYIRAGSFIGLSLDPIAIVSLTGLFKN